MDRDNNVLVIGSSNLDMILQVKRLPRPGETVGGGLYSQANGGKGANQAVAALRAGANVTFISCVGQDSFGRTMKAEFEAEGMNVTYLMETDSAPTGVALIFVDKNGENSIGVGPGANYALTTGDINKASQAFDAAAFALLQLEVPLEVVQYAMNKAIHHKVPVILNPAPAAPLPDELLSQVYLLVLNETETEVITGINPADQETLKESTQWLLDKGVQNVIITLGKEGSYVRTMDDAFRVMAPKVDAVDTTAAGDVYCGNLVAALGRGLALAEAVKFATAASALSVMKLGAQPSAPYRSATQEFLTE